MKLVNMKFDFKPTLKADFFSCCRFRESELRVYLGVTDRFNLNRNHVQVGNLNCKSLLFS